MADVRRIDANLLIKHITESVIEVTGDNGLAEEAVKCYQAVVLKFIATMPTINPGDLRPRGRWICKNKAYGEYECSACGGLDTNCSDYYSSHDVTEQDYCPNCGAKMDGKENEDA